MNRKTARIGEPCENEMRNAQMMVMKHAVRNDVGCTCMRKERMSKNGGEVFTQLQSSGDRLGVAIFEVTRVRKAELEGL